MDVWIYLLALISVYIGTLAGFVLTRMTRDELSSVHPYVWYGSAILFGGMAGIIVAAYSLIAAIFAGLIMAIGHVLLRKKYYYPYTYGLIGVLFGVAALQSNFYVFALLAFLYSVFMMTYQLAHSSLSWKAYGQVMRRAWYLFAAAIVMLLGYLGYTHYIF